MFHAQPSPRWRLFAISAAMIAALLATVTVWGATRAADPTATPASAATAGCAQASTTKGDPAGTPAAGANCVDVGLYDIYYGANLITIPSNTDVKFVLDNKGAATHTFVITDHNNKDVKNLNINVSIDPGKSSDVTINAPAGTYYYWCDIPGHEQAGMWGILKVEDNAKISAQSVDDPKKA